ATKLYGVMRPRGERREKPTVWRSSARSHPQFPSSLGSAEPRGAVHAALTARSKKRDLGRGPAGRDGLTLGRRRTTRGKDDPLYVAVCRCIDKAGAAAYTPRNVPPPKRSARSPPGHERGNPGMDDLTEIAVPSEVSRRAFLKQTGLGIAGASLATMLEARQAPAQIRGTSLRILLWSHFVPAYDVWYDQFVKEW